MSAIIMYTTGAYLTPMKVVDSDGKELFVWAVTSFEDSGFLDGEDYDPIERAKDLKTLTFNRNNGEVKWCFFRDFIYGQDVTEFDENQKVVLYETKQEAQISLKEYIEDLNDSFTNGDIENGYEGDLEIKEVLVFYDDDYMIDLSGDLSKKIKLTQE